MTSQPQPAPEEGRSALAILRPLRDIAAWALVAAPAVLLFVAVIRLIPSAVGENFASRTQDSFYSFVNLPTLLFPLGAVLLALLVHPQHPKAKVITVLAAVEYAVAGVFGVIFGVLVGLVQILGFSVRVAFEEFLVRISWLAVLAVAAFAVYQLWRGLFHVPKPKPEPGMYGQPQYGVPGTYPGQPGYGPGPGQPGQYGPGGGQYGPGPGQYGPGQYGGPPQGEGGQPGWNQPQPGQGHPGQHPGQGHPGQSQPGQGQPGQPQGQPGQPQGQPTWNQSAQQHPAPAYGRPAEPGYAAYPVGEPQSAPPQSTPPQSTPPQSAPPYSPSSQSDWGQPPVSAQPVSAQPVSAQPVSVQPVSAQPSSAQPLSAQPASGPGGPPPGPYAPEPGHVPGPYSAAPAGEYSPYSEPTQAVPRPGATAESDRTQVFGGDRPGYGPADEDPPRR